MDGKEKKSIILIVLFFVVIIVSVIWTELSIRDYEYGEPYEMAAVVVDKEAIKKSSRIGSKVGRKNKSSNYDYYVYVKLEDGEEVRVECSNKTQYEQYEDGQNITVIRQELTDDGEFLQMVYSLK